VIKSIAAGIMTSKRPVNMLQRTLDSLAAAGFDNEPITLWHDTRRIGHMGAWLKLLKSLSANNPSAEALLLLEDDVVFCSGLKDYLLATLWPTCERPIAVCSIFCPHAYRQDSKGWHRQEKRSYYLCASQAWVVPTEAATAILDKFGAQERHEYNADRIIGEWAYKSGRSVLYHTPSLVQHIGIGNSAMGNPTSFELHYSSDFIGEGGKP
jgi:hypothetical protein